MKALTIIIAAAALSLAAAVCADDGVRTFNFTADTPVRYILNGNEESGEKWPWKMPTVVTVIPYLYVSGNFGSSFSVQGWGSGTSPMEYTTIEIRHNQTLSIVFSHFEGVLDRVEDGGAAQVAVEIKYSAAIVNQNDQPIFRGSGYERSGEFGSGGLDGTISSIEPSVTAGRFFLRMGVQIRVAPGTGPGIYRPSHEPTITILRV